MYHLSGILKCFVFNDCYKSMNREVCLKQGRKISDRVFLVTGPLARGSPRSAITSINIGATHENHAREPRPTSEAGRLLWAADTGLGWSGRQADHRELRAKKIPAQIEGQPRPPLALTLTRKGNSRPRRDQRFPLCPVPRTLRSGHEQIHRLWLWRRSGSPFPGEESSCSARGVATPPRCFTRKLSFTLNSMLVCI